MKKNVRSITRKNLLGGFLGGVCGILVFNYIHEALLPLGVLAGVVTGWWYEAIWAMICKNIFDGLNLGQNYYRRLRSFITKCVQYVGKCAQSSLWGLLRKKTTEVSEFAPFFGCIAAIFLWLFTRPIGYYKWFNRHPMNRAYVLRALLIALQIICIVAAAIYLAHLLTPETIPGMQDGRGGWIPARLPNLIDYTATTFFICIFPILIMFLCFNLEMEDRTISQFFQDFERYASNGPARYFFYHLKKSLVIQAKMYAFMLLSLAYFSGVGALFIAIFIVPVAVFIGTIRGINEIVMRKGHWLCLGITMTVTALVAYLFGPYFGNTSILWIAALSAGIISGCLTEGARRVIVWVFENTKIGRQLSEIRTGEFLKNRIFPHWGVAFNFWKKIIGVPLAI
jgi:hypothetical protein